MQYQFYNKDYHNHIKVNNGNDFEGKILMKLQYIIKKLTELAYISRKD